MKDRFLIPTNSKYSGELSVISLRLPQELVQQADELANKSNRSRNQLLTMCIEYALSKAEITESE